MLKSSQLTRSAVVAATVLSLGASPAVARQADAPLRPEPAASAAPATRHWTQPRVDGIGVRPVDRPAAVAPAVPVTRASHAPTAGDWLLLPIAAMAALGLLALVAVLRTSRHWARPYRARRL